MPKDKIIISDKMATTVAKVAESDKEVDVLFSAKSIIARHPDFDEDGKRVSIRESVKQYFTDDLFRKVLPDLTDEECNVLRHNLSNKLVAVRRTPEQNKHDILNWMFPIFQDICEVANSPGLLFKEQPSRTFNGWAITFDFNAQFGEFVMFSKGAGNHIFTRDMFQNNSPYVVYHKFKEVADV